MSTARLNIWITKKGDPCRIDNNPQPQQLFVYVLHCSGEVLEWCGKKYVGIQARCGHLELEIPVGCYVVGAVENPGGIPPLGNHLTHLAIVRANCGDHICVTLFNPTLHHCAHWFATAMNGHLAAGGQALPATLAGPMRNAAQAVEGLVKAIPQDAFTTTQAKAIGTVRPTEGTGKKGRK